MSQITDIEIRCVHCLQWNPSPIMFSNLDDLLSNLTTITNNKLRCAHCNQWTPCNRENMRVKSPDGGFRGLDTL